MYTRTCIRICVLPFYLSVEDLRSDMQDLGTTMVKFLVHREECP